MRTSTPSRAAPFSASTSDGDGVKYAVAIQIERSRRDRLDLERARYAQAKRLAFDDADERGFVGRGIEMRAARRAAQEPMRAAAFVPVRAAPHVVERLHHVVRRGPVDLDRGVAPARAMQLLHAGRPFAADADAAGDADASSTTSSLRWSRGTKPSQRRKPGRLNTATCDARALERLEELARRAAPADPVEQQPHVDAASTPRGRARPPIR